MTTVIGILGRMMEGKKDDLCVTRAGCEEWLKKLERAIKSGRYKLYKASEEGELRESISLYAVAIRKMTSEANLTDTWYPTVSLGK